MSTEIQNPVVQKPARRRILYLDYLRIFTTYTVILIHVSSQNWNQVPLDSFAWRVFSLYNCGKSFQLPIFLMLTSVLFMDNDRPLNIKHLYTKNIFRLVTTFFFWSGIYALNEYLHGYNIWYISETFLRGDVHMWYLFLAVGYYVSIPIFRQITLSKQITEYFLLVTGIWLMAVPTGLSLLEYLNPPMLSLPIKLLRFWNDAIPIGFSGILLFYLILGFYLHKYDLKPWLRKIMPVLAVIGYAGRVVFLDHYVQHTGSRDLPFLFEALDIPVAVTLFLFGRNVLSKWQPSEKALALVKSLSANCFGIFMMHMLVMYLLQNDLGLNTLSFNPIFSVPVIALVIFIISYGISLILHKIPILKKYVV